MCLLVRIIYLANLLEETDTTEMQEELFYPRNKNIS